MTKNWPQIIGYDHTFRALLLTRVNSGLGAAVTSAEEIRQTLIVTDPPRRLPSRLETQGHQILTIIIEKKN